MRFQARMLGLGNHPLWRDDLRNSAGQPITGLGEWVPAYADLPMEWTPHIQIGEVAGSM